MKIEYSNYVKFNVDYSIDGFLQMVYDNGFQLWKYTDPTEPARPISEYEAREIAKEDPTLIYAIK